MLTFYFNCGGILIRPALLALLFLISGSAAGAAAPDLRALVENVDPRRIEADIESLVSFGTRHTLSDTLSATRGIGAARNWVRDEFERISRASGGRLQVSFDYFTPDSSARVPVPRQMANVVAILPGTSEAARGRYYVVSGHLDSRASDIANAEISAPGANDDASGVAVVLEAARVLSPVPLDATVVFIAFVGEEQGLLGSGHWAKAAKARGMNVAGMITNDIVGGSGGGKRGENEPAVRVFSEGISSAETPAEARTRAAIGGENDSVSRQLARWIRAVAGAAVPGFDVRLISRRDRFLRGGDHIPFNEAGYAAVRFTEPVEDFRRQHQDIRAEEGVEYGDVIEAVDFDYVANVARVNVAAIAGLALAPGVPDSVVILTKELTNDTTLRWLAPPDPDVTGYRVVWRETTDAEWKNQWDVGNVPAITLERLSKDNLIFGVQALDRDGYASPAVYPKPSRN